jgi:type IV fimbrial biogenesis protein FimT
MRQRGFTLVEVLISVAILAILLGIAVPQFSNILQSARMTNARNGIYSLFQIARTEALVRRTHVVVCASVDGQNCVGNWNQGGLVFLDQNRNRRHEASERILAVLSGEVMAKLQVSGNRLLTAYMPSGRSSGSNQTISVCAPGRRDGYSVVISNAGRVRTGRVQCAV